MTRNKLHLVIFVTFLSAYLWIGYNIYLAEQNIQHTFTVCLFKSITGIPCPSCGITTSIVLLLHGKIVNALNSNPLGIPVSATMFLIPFWIFIDIILKKETFYNFYMKSENLFKQKYIALPALLLITILWSWKIFYN